MKKPFLTIGRVVLTLLIVSFAVVVVWRMVMYYMFAPWTRDGHIRADIVQIAPDVSGLIQRVDVRDNQLVTKGQVLFAVDQDRFKLALRQAQAAVADRQETLAQAQREYKRNRGLGNLVPSEQLEESQSRVARAQSALAEAQVTVDSAQLNLDRSVIRSPVDGYVNDRAPRTQEFVTAGRPVLSLHMGMAQQGRHATEVYQGFLQRHGVLDVVEILACDGERPVAGLSLLRDNALGHFSVDELGTLHALQGLLEIAALAPYSQVDERLANLTPREREIAWLLRDGADNKSIARRLDLGLPTVKTHLINLFRKVGVGNRTELVSALFL